MEKSMDMVKSLTNLENGIREIGIWMWDRVKVLCILKIETLLQENLERIGLTECAWYNSIMEVYTKAKLPKVSYKEKVSWLI
jgi:hypothetical protein